jgi:hypothetical protein
VPDDWVQAELGGFVYVPLSVVLCDDSEPRTLMTVFVVLSVIVMLKLLSLSVVALARKLLPLIHMLLGTGTLPV